MTQFNCGEHGGPIYANFGTDISSAASLTFALEPRQGDRKDFLENIAIGAVDVEVGDQTFLSGEYLVYTVQEADLDFVGQWRSQGGLNLGSELIKTDFDRFTVLA